MGDAHGLFMSFTYRLARRYGAGPCFIGRGSLTFSSSTMRFPPGTIIRTCTETTGRVHVVLWAIVYDQVSTEKKNSKWDGWLLQGMHFAMIPPSAYILVVVD